MEAAAKKTLIPSACAALVCVADPMIAQRLAREIERFSKPRLAGVVSSLAHLREVVGRMRPAVILLDDELLKSHPLAETVRQLTATAGVILLAPPEREADAANLVAAGGVDFVARTGDFVPLAAALVQRRLRWSEMSESLLDLPWNQFPADLGSIFRHEINNPLTGILGNAELLLAHRERLTAADTQRLQTVVDLAVRLRETIRRLSNAWESQSHSLKSA